MAYPQRNIGKNAKRKMRMIENIWLIMIYFRFLIISYLPNDHELFADGVFLLRVIHANTRLLIPMNMKKYPIIYAMSCG